MWQRTVKLAMRAQHRANKGTARCEDKGLTFRDHGRQARHVRAQEIDSPIKSCDVSLGRLIRPAWERGKWRGAGFGFGEQKDAERSTELETQSKTGAPRVDTRVQ